MTTLPATYRVMQLDAPGQPLRRVEPALPRPGPEQVLVRVNACGVCRTDLHVVDGELPDSRPPIVPGHEIVARVAALGSAVRGHKVGQRVGVPWQAWTCGTCTHCRAGRENLCDQARFHGYQVDGGYADDVLADARYCFTLPEGDDDAALAPLLCAGLVGYRALGLAGDALRLGIYGFGTAAYIVAQVARWQGRRVYAFTRLGDTAAQRFVIELEAVWAGDSGQAPPEPLDAALIFAPVGAWVPETLRRERKGGTVVCGGIHLSDIPAFPYAHLWGERQLRSVANRTRRDGADFLALAPQVSVHTRIETFPLTAANEALARRRAGQLTGAAVLIP